MHFSGKNFEDLEKQESDQKVQIWCYFNFLQEICFPENCTYDLPQFDMLLYAGH